MEINIGQKFITRGKRKDLCTVTDIYKTYNHKNELVSIKYVATHEFCGQLVTNYNVPATTIVMGLINT